MMLTTKKNVFIWALSALMLAAGTYLILSSDKQKQAASDLLPVELHAIKLSDGWGYEVLVDNKVYIHQDCIPAISTYKRFKSEADALLIGNKVVAKIKEGKKPALSVQDITDAHITY